MDETNNKRYTFQSGTTLKDFYKDALDEKDIKILKSLNEETKYIEANFYANNLCTMGFNIINDSVDIALSSEEINSYSKDYVKIERDGLFGLASLKSSKIYVPCDFNKIQKNNNFKFNAFTLYKNKYVYIYNYDKDVIMAKMEGDEIEYVMDGSNIITRKDNKKGIYNILKNKYILDCEYEDVFYYDERVIALLNNNIITIFNYINSKVLLEYKFSSDEYYMESKELSSKNVFVINKENKLGLLNIFTGEFLVVPEYENIEFVECYGKKSMVILKKDNKYGLYNLDKKEFIIQCICDEIKTPIKNIRKYIFIYTVNGYKGAASDERVLTNYIFNEVDIYNKGLYLVCKTDKNCYVFDNEKCLFTFDNNEKFKVLNLDSKRGIFKGTRFSDKDIICIDFNNRGIDGYLMYYTIEEKLEDNSGYVIKTSNDHYFIYCIDKDTIYDNIIKNKYYSYVKKIQKYLVCFKGDKCALADNYGNLITSIKYNDIYENSEGLIILKANNYIGYFNNGMATKCVYDSLNSLTKENNKYIIANKEGKRGLLEEGKVLIPFEYEEIFLADKQYIKEICEIFNINNENEKIKFIARKCGKFGVCSESGFIMSEFLNIEHSIIQNITIYN